MTENHTKLYKISATITRDSYTVSVKEFDILEYIEGKYMVYSDNSCKYMIYSHDIRLDTPIYVGFDEFDKPQKIIVLTFREELISDYKRLIKDAFIRKVNSEISQLKNLLEIINKYK